MSFNKVIMIGNLTRDPAMRYTSGGAAVCECGLAVNRKFSTAGGETREEVAFIDVTVWGKQGESLAQYMTKGSQVLVEGRIAQDTWEDKQTGQKRSKLYVVAENVRFLGAPGGNRQDQDQGDDRGYSRQDRGYGEDRGYGQDHPAQRQPQRPPQGRPAPQRPAMPAFQGPDNESGSLDDIPF
ncbi:MAG: single-stranded DNA-binding protein [Lentisphaeria bacterium]|jgi:single-strand DNA-binding protein|nr:single-stranded DNA-binding protein [Lentisphaeria bacterium]